MPIKSLSVWLLLLGFCLAGAKAGAQQLPSEETFDQAKLAIWCESIYFIYKDYGADSLGQQLDCKSWDGFRESIRPNHLQVHTFFQAVERPEIYAGYSSNEARLSKLADEITSKLRASSSRRNRPARLQRVDSLQQELLQLAQNPVLFSSDQPGQAGMQAPLLQEEDQDRTPGAAEEGMFPWAEVLQWLLILALLASVAWLWNENRRLKKSIAIRMARRKQEIAALEQQQERADKQVSRLRSSNSPDRAALKELIRQELAKLQREQEATPQQEEPEQEQSPSRAAEGYQEEEGTAVKALQDLQEEQTNPGIYYDKLPFKGGFHHKQLSTQRQPDSIYSIKVSGQQSDEAEFWVTEDAEIQKYAMENGLSFFEEACEYDRLEENPSRVNNLERGRLRKRGQLWQIEKKARVSFE